MMIQWVLNYAQTNRYVEEYKSSFEGLSNRLRGLSEGYKLNCFLSGLKDDIRLPVRMFNPKIRWQPTTLLRFKSRKNSRVFNPQHDAEILKHNIVAALNSTHTNTQYPLFQFKKL